MNQTTQPKRVLVVDDQPFITKLIQVNLAKEDYTIIACHDPVEALNRIEEWAPDLLIVDVRMPKMSGTELCQELRARASTRDVPIIVLTGQGQSATAVEAQKAGANAFMTKPFSPKALAAKVRELLQAKGERR